MLKITLLGKAFVRIFVAALLLLLSTRGGGAAELKKLTAGYSTVGPAGIGLWMAKEIGAFDKYGIDAQLIFVSSGPIVVQALLGGDMQAGLAATNAVTAAVLAGAPLVSVMSLINRPYYRCWVQPEITRMEELRGFVSFGGQAFYSRQFYGAELVERKTSLAERFLCFF